MKKIEFEKSERFKIYNWFKNFSNSTYGVNMKMDVTKLINHTKKYNESFFIDFLFIVLKGLNSIDEMRMRLYNNTPVIYDDISPSFTVMTELGTFDTCRFKNNKNFKEFYNTAKNCIQEVKKQKHIKRNGYNPNDSYDDYYITCLPWISFEQFTHAIPDDKHSQCVPRICWGKYEEKNGKYEVMLNITVSHIFVDGYPLSQAFIKIQELLNNADEILK